MTKNNYLFPFIMITSLFFMWGFVHNLDPVLIPHLKRSFSLNTLQATLVDSAVFIAYFVMALPAGFLLKKYGYKTGIIVGLSFFAVGSFLFIPAANTQLYVFFLGALFIIACGLTILETAANPYASLLGPPETATFRLNFAQMFNGLAASLAPVIGARVILIEGLSDDQLSTMSASARELALASEASSVKTPYLILGGIILLITIIFIFIKLPEIKEQEEVAGEKIGVLEAFKHNHLTWAVVAQFFYVGAQVCVFSLFLLYATKVTGINQKTAADYLGGAGLAFLIGRVIGTFLMRFFKPVMLLAIYSVISIALCIVAITASGMVALFSVIGIAFFMSIMFPTIFSLGIKDLGKDTKFGSSLIIMSIVGGAILPPIMGYITDLTGTIQMGYFVPLICFVMVLLFAVKGHKVIKTV
ncbi:MAG: L-fucose:H+ symporter permease [Bacteroidota bacterium]